MKLTKINNNASTHMQQPSFAASVFQTKEAGKVLSGWGEYFSREITELAPKIKKIKCNGEEVNILIDSSASGEIEFSAFSGFTKTGGVYLSESMSGRTTVPFNMTDRLSELFVKSIKHVVNELELKKNVFEGRYDKLI